jgi:uncharacterized protein (TIGR02246 family)
MRFRRLASPLLCVLAGSLFLAASVARGGPKEDVAAATMTWAQTLNQNDPDKVVLLYATDGVLWGTLSPAVRADRAALRDYFVSAFKLLPNLKVAFGEQLIRVYGRTAVNTGYYTFSYIEDGEAKALAARYSFTFVKEDEHWMIVDHHSSAMPALLAAGSDRVAVEAVIDTWNEGWRIKNAALAAQGYSSDADWINAFGMRERGRDAIAAKLKEVFGLPFVMGAESRVVKQEIRFITPAVAVVITQVEREGQKSPSGEQLGTRRTSHQRVLVKEREQWRIVSHLISDARDTASARH